MHKDAVGGARVVDPTLRLGVVVVVDHDGDHGRELGELLGRHLAERLDPLAHNAGALFLAVDLEA